MKKERKSRFCNGTDYEKYDYTDTRYYGVWSHGKKSDLKVKLDPKRFQKATGHKFTAQQLAVIHKRKTKYFFPAKTNYYDYDCNRIVDFVHEIEKDWHNNFQKLIHIAEQRIEKPRTLTAGDYRNFSMGISNIHAADTWARMTNEENERAYRIQVAQTMYGLYSQFIQQMASQIEAITVNILTKHRMIDDKFDRNVLYGGKHGDTAVRDLPHFSCHDRLYCLWNFLKHNSESTYNTLKDRFPGDLKDQEFQQGMLAIYYVQFSDDMISELLKGCIEFFKEYCELIFNENYEEAQWNYGAYFHKIVRDYIEDIDNPMGLSWWDDID